MGLARPSVLAHCCLGLSPSGRFGVVAWLVARAVRWSMVVGPFWLMFRLSVRIFQFFYVCRWSLAALKCDDTRFDRYPHVLDVSGMFAGHTFPQLGSGLHSVPDCVPECIVVHR